MLCDTTGFYFFSSRRRHTGWTGDWSSDVCSSDLTVHDPTQMAGPADRGDDFVERAARVQDHGQRKITRDFELAVEIESLRIRIEVRDEEIQSAFADCRGLLAFDPADQGIQVFRPVRCQVHRMQAVGGVNSALGSAQIAQGRECVESHSGDNLAADASATRAPQYGSAIGVEFSSIQMRVAVDQIKHAAEIPEQSMRRGCHPGGWFRNGSHDALETGDNRSRLRALLR